jgi:hypothetical protein
VVTQLAQGKPAEALNTGMSATERLLGAEGGALALAPGGPLASAGGAIIGSFAPNFLQGFNDKVINSEMPATESHQQMEKEFEFMMFGPKFYSMHHQ